MAETWKRFLVVLLIVPALALTIVLPNVFPQWFAPPHGELSGTVSFDNKRVLQGKLFAYDDDGKFLDVCEVDEGTYFFAKLRAGSIRLAFKPPQVHVQKPLAPQQPLPDPNETTCRTGMTRKMDAVAMQALQRYGDPFDSGLSATIAASAKNIYDIRLKSN
jgi:hypothetical protein